MVQNKLIEELVLLLHLTPSGDNCRPFHFEYIQKTQQLNIIYCKKQAEHILNPNELSSCVSLGMMDYVISNCGLKIVFKDINLTEIKNDQAIIAQYQFDLNQGKLDLELKDSILNRNTFRFKFNQKIKQLNLEGLLFLPDLPNHLESLMLEKEDQIWTNEKIINDIFKWVHLTKTRALDNKLGMYWKELGMTWLEFPFVLLLKYTTGLSILLYKVFINKIIKKHLGKLYSSSSFIFVPLVSERVEEKSMFELGYLSYQKWLKLTSLGYTLQPLSFYTFSDFGNNNIIDEINSIFKTKYCFFWIFRIGKIDYKKPNKEKRALPLEKILRII